MPQTKPVIVYEIEDARKVLKVAQASGVTPWMITPKNAGTYLGGGYLSSLIAVLKKEYPALPFTLSVDCSNRSGRVLASLQHGVKDIIFTGSKEMCAKLSDIAGQYDATIRPLRPADALDIRFTDGYDKELKAWWGLSK